MQHDRSAYPDCRIPPDCLHLDGLPHFSSDAGSNLKATHFPPIHIHINNQPLTATSKKNLASESHHGLKRPRSASVSDSDDGSDDSEPILLLRVLEDLDGKFPKLNFPQYARILEEKGIFYAESAIDFDREYFMRLGFCEGAVGTFLSGIQKALVRQKGLKKRARVNGTKENRA